MRPIKFRGRNILDGRTVYGELIHKDGKFYLTDYVHYCVEVDPDSLAPFAGYDANGKKVYEGDIVLRYDSKDEFDEAPENGKIRQVEVYTDIQVYPDLNAYYCLLKEGKS